MGARETVRVKFHLSESTTKVIIEMSEGQGMADGGVEVDIPTRIIPVDLRTIGSRFVLIFDDPIPNGKEWGPRSNICIERLPPPSGSF